MVGMIVIDGLILDEDEAKAYAADQWLRTRRVSEQQHIGVPQPRRCCSCGETFVWTRYRAGRPAQYCPACREEVKREQARHRMAAMRRRRGHA